MRFALTPQTPRRAATAAFGLITSCAFLTLLFYHYRLISHPYPLEYREGAMLLATNLLMHGVNPFDIANMPLATNMYGIGYPLVVSLLAQVLGYSLWVHHLTAGIFILGSCALLFTVLLRNNISLLYCFAAISIFYASLLNGVTAVARPDSLGLFLFILSIFIPLRFNYSMSSLVISITAGIAAYYTKQYFVLSCIYVCIYMFLFVSKRMAIYYGIAFACLFVLCATAVNNIFETYFVSTIFTFKFTLYSWGWLVKQLKAYSLVNFGLISILFYCAWDLWRDAGIGSLSGWCNISGWSEPFLKLNCSLPLCCLLLSCFIICILLGRSTGAWLNYLFQLITPFLLIVSFSCNSKLLRSETNVFGNSYSKNIISMFLIVFTMLLTCFSLPLLSQADDDKSWREIEQLVISSNNILNSPAIAPLIIKHGKPLYDSGLTEAWKYADYSPPVLSSYLPPVDLIRDRWIKYLDDIKNMVIHKKFDFIILTDGIPNSFITPDIVEKYYEKSGAVLLNMPHANQQWRLIIWKPRVGGDT